MPPVVFGCGWPHQLGAAVAAYGAGVLRETFGNYTMLPQRRGMCRVAALM